jgi:hypothetical protein
LNLKLLRANIRYAIVSGSGGVVNQQAVRSEIDILSIMTAWISREEKPAVPADKLADQL